MSDSVEQTADPATPAYWRVRAREAQFQAELTRDPEVKAILMEIADDYWKLADKAEVQR